MKLRRQPLAGPLLCLYLLGPFVLWASSWDAAGFLKSLPSSVGSNLILIDQTVKVTKQTPDWQLSVNDVQVFSFRKMARDAEIRIRFAMSVRPGDNVVRLESVRRKGDGSVEVTGIWVTHINRLVDPPGDPIALLIQGQPDDPNSRRVLGAFRNRLVNLGFKQPNIYMTTSFSDVNGVIDNLSQRRQETSRLLIYFYGTARRLGTDGEPALQFQDERSTSKIAFPITDLIRTAADFSNSSVIIDASFPEDTRIEKEGIDSTRMAAPWLQSWSLPANVEVVLSHRGPSELSNEVGRLTDALADPDRWESTSPHPCTTLADVVLTLNAQYKTMPGAGPLYFTSNSSFRSFCVSTSDVSSALNVSVKPVSKGDPFLQAADITVDVSPGRARWIDILVDGVVLRHDGISPAALAANNRSLISLIETVAIGDGKHLITVRSGVGTDVISERSVEYQPAGGSKVIELLPSHDLVARFIEPSVSQMVTANPFASVVFTVGTSVGRAHYELKNNEVSIRRGIAEIARGQRLVRVVPLVLGRNVITIEVTDHNQIARSAITVLRRRSEPLRAVLIGVDAPRGSPRLPFVAADVELFREILLRFTDASLEDIKTLTGELANKAAIEHAIGSTVRTRPLDPLSQGIMEPDTFILYYAGYGVTFEDKARSKRVRCILPSDFDPSRSLDTCISTGDLDDLLDAQDRSIVVVDSSYDGKSTIYSLGNASLQSRTYQDFIATDTTWRQFAGIDRPERMFLVASGGNSPALESNELKHGVFTRSLADSISEQLSPSVSATERASKDDLSVYDAFAVARNKASSLTDGQEQPLIKGVLSTPFTFFRRSPSDRLAEADSIVVRAIHDRSALRALNSADLARAISLYRKVLFFAPGDERAQEGLTEAYLLQGDLGSAGRLIEGILDSNTMQGRRRSRWLLLRARLRTLQGDIGSATEDCQKARLAAPVSLRAEIQLASLYVAAGKYDDARDTFEKMIDRLKDGSSGDNVLDDEEWGKSVLLAYVVLRLAGDQRSALLLLKSYSQSYRQKNELKQIFVANPLFRIIFPRESYAVAMGSKDVDEPWSHSVAQYFLATQKESTDLSSFRNNTLSLDPKDEDSFNCSLYFYLAMRSLLDGNKSEAIADFDRVIATNKTEYMEYWIAKFELSTLN